MSSNRTILITGGSSGIASALVDLLLVQTDLNIHVASRGERPEALDSRVQWHRCDYTDDALAALRDALEQHSKTLDYLVIPNGVLHDDGVFPERALRELKEEAMAQVFATNTLLPMRILSAMTPLLRKAEAPRIVAFSARVGSIGDNGLGGWYSYRGSKAALNMMLRCAAIEFRRLNRGAKLIAFHPGTTDTPLSKPFQARVPEDKLFKPEFVAERLWKIIEDSRADGELSYVDWAGETIPW